jgi:ribosome-binding protein aMBF1 (putative translation factor)
MDERMQQLETYFEALKTRGEKLPKQVGQQAPHFRAVSAASGIDFQYVIKEPYRQRVLLAAEKIGLSLQEGTQAAMWERKFIQNRTKLDNYLSWLAVNAFKLPEDPTRSGRIFFPQVAVEIGLTPQVLNLRKNNGERAYNVQLRQAVEKAATNLGLEVRVLPQSPGHQHLPFTYEQLFGKGTEERKKELTDSSSASAQLYNTRYALNLFLQILRLEATAPIGPEFVAGFKSSVKKVTGEISNINSRKKFQTEINRWQDIYQRLLKGPSIPEDIHRAITHLIDRSGLSLPILAKMIGIGLESLRAWYEGSETPSLLSVRSLERMEALFKISAGTLVNKISGLRSGKRFRISDLPSFLQQNPDLFHRVSKHLPDKFCTLTLEEQKKTVESIRTHILRGGDEYGQHLLTITRLPYRLREWPGQVRAEFDFYADFKMAEKVPLGMQRNGKWRPTTKVKSEMDLAYLLGAICLPADAEDERLRGLSFPKSQLTLALLVCPTLIDWYIKFRCEARNQYTEYPIGLLQDFISMLRPGTGWLRQNPHLAARLQPFAGNITHYISQDLVRRAQSDWHGVCDEAIKEYKELISNIKPRAIVARDPFHRIEGLLAFDNPMEPLGILIQEMKRDLPNPHTQPVHYHTRIRDIVITILFVVTGFRRGTLAKLDYTGDETGQLYLEGNHYVLSVPRTFFKIEDSSYFQSNRVKEDYLNKLPNVFGLNEVLKEYLEVSRPFLMKKYHSRSSEQPLFITSVGTGPAGIEPATARLRGELVSCIFTKKIEKYLVENKHRGTGVHKVKRTGPHSVRHVRGTTVYRKTRSYKLAGDANQHSERTARKHYSRFTTEERNREVNEILF